MSTAITVPRRRARVGTIVWGGVIVVVAALVLASQFIALSIDPVIVALGLLVGVGLALVAGGILSLRRQTGEDDGLDTGEDPDDDPLSTRY